MLNVSAPLSRETEINAPYIAVSDPNGNQTLYPIENDSNLMIGSDENCRLRLRGDDIAAEQCMVFRVGDHVTLRDWYSEGCTLLNGQPFSGMQPLNCGDVLAVGDYKLQFVLTEQSAQQFQFNPALTHEGGGTTNSVDTPAANSSLDCNSGASDQQSALGSQMVTQQMRSDPQAEADIHRLQRELSESRHEIEQLQAALERQLELEVDEPGNMVLPAADNAEVAQLKQQVELLTNQLAQRDSELAGNDSGLNDDDQLALDPEETERLVSRLEELLVELEQADQRVESMEEMLRMSEESVRAEQEERDQLAKWVGQIETLISQKESDFANERNQLQDQLDLANESRQELQERIEQMIQQRERSGGEAGNEALLCQLREQNDQLREDLSKTSNDLRTTKQEQEKLQSILDNQELPPAVQSKMQEMEIELAQKRAEIARFKAATTDMSVLEKSESSKAMNDADLRFQAMRDHLREARQQELESKKEKQLGNRIASLWRRLGKR